MQGSNTFYFIDRAKITTRRGGRRSKGNTITRVHLTYNSYITHQCIYALYCSLSRCYVDNASIIMARDVLGVIFRVVSVQMYTNCV